ncbi:META domain-containing protein [Pacificimonas flava]|uniref:DUF306 domain-containing protein n=1 Tax=Pacificimonas flava TaxID=1234595 RepID=M2TKJ5_9SPHN|nr:hypothetical protein [Pacificimonas flava]EMD82191.1 hypothetical protein C725_2477 [Pacificimonas flava]MBB5280331.1 putative membrane protein [Pacificimonas flava]
MALASLCLIAACDGDAARDDTQSPAGTRPAGNAGNETDADGAATSESETPLGRAARSVTGAGLRAARELNRPVKSAEPARLSETLAITGTGGTWHALLTPQQLVFRTPERRGWYAASYSGTVTSGSHELKLPESRSTLRVMPGACRDPQLAPAHPHGVTFAHGGNALTGCAGAVKPPEELENTVWRILAVGEEVPPADAHTVATLSFDRRGHIGGTAGCSAAHLPLALDGNGFTQLEAASGAREEAEPEDGSDGNIPNGNPTGMRLTRGDCEAEGDGAFGRMALAAMDDALGWTINDGRLIVDLGNGNELIASPITQRQTSFDNRP